jgi:hypothetical protein
MYASMIPAVRSIALVVLSEYSAASDGIHRQDEERSVEEQCAVAIFADCCDGRGVGCPGTEF